MSADVTIAATSLSGHPLRAAVLGEVHARPFTPIETPRRALHFAFETTAEQGEADRAALTDFCTARGLSAPQPAAKHHRVALGTTALRWEQHSEFTTYTWELPSESPTPFHPDAATLGGAMGLVPQPGPVLVAVDLHLLGDGTITPEKLLDHASLAAAENSDGTALYATDFRSDAGGYVHILILDRGLGPERAGALTQRVLEIETYRTLSLLGLPEAQRLAPGIRRIESRLAELTDAIGATEGLKANHKLLDDLTALAAELEAGAAASQFRFGASRAYDEIVRRRLETIGERKYGGWPTWSSFLARRVAPALRTCATMEERQANLSHKLSRAADLLRTRVDVEQQQQNRNLLASMNERTRLQLMLQATVEGLSVAAISYYVVGLFGYLVKGLHDAHLLRIDPALATGAFVPVAVLLVWWVGRRVRSKHIKGVK
jgi:uncharacterized membrane-anchored protein